MPEDIKCIGAYSGSLMFSRKNVYQRREPAMRWIELWTLSEDLRETFPTFRNFIYFVSIKAIDITTSIKDIIKKKKYYDKKKVKK